MNQSKQKVNFIFTLFLAITFIYCAIEAMKFSEKAQFFPLYISILAIILVLIELIMTSVSTFKRKYTSQPLHPHLKKVIFYLGLILLLLGLIRIIGFKIGSTIFVTFFLWLLADFKWVKAIVAGIIVFLCLEFFGDYYMNLYWPQNLMGW